MNIFTSHYLKGFTIHLNEINLAKSTIKTYENIIKEADLWFSAFPDTNHIPGYKDILHYLKHITDKGNAKATQSLKIGVIRKYFDYLVRVEHINNNPITHLYIKGRMRRIPNQLLEPDVLEKLYTSCSTSTPESRKNKVILGLLIYQGLTKGEIERLQESDLQLQEGKIYITGSTVTNSRVLPLQACQLLGIQEYIKEIRPILLLKHQSCLQSNHNKLFIYCKRGLNNTLFEFMKHLKEINPSVKNSSQIRQSVISEWLKTKDVRIVQYMAGHKYISSTERYQTTNLENLKQQIRKYHPLG